MQRTLVYLAVTALAACGSRTAGGTDENDDSQTGQDDTDDGETDSTDDGPVLDVGEVPPDSGRVDFLFVIDNSPSMREEQHNVGQNLLGFWEELANLTDLDGNPGLVFESDVHVMVTTTDIGGPACPDVDGYSPAMGGPITQGCNARIDEFSNDEIDVSAACTDACPVDVLPDGNFIAFDPEGESNVPADDFGAALACLGTQGIVGCEYAQPLEAMLRALDPEADWNQGPDPFLRDDSSLVVVLITDQPDCSIADPGAFSDTGLMNVHPDSGQPEPSHAICWNALAECEGKDANGTWEDCSPAPTGMHPVERYVERLRDELAFEEGRIVLMLAALGVPEVTQHNDQPPFEPIAGGIHDLVYRDWRDGFFPAGDLLPEEGPSAAHEQWRHGIGPGCLGEDGMGGFIGHATPPVRVNEVCQALDEGDAVRCCIESVCDHDFSAMAKCLTADFPCPVGTSRQGERCIVPN